jgi:hypothetical protein
MILVDARASSTLTLINLQCGNHGVIKSLSVDLEIPKYTDNRVRNVSTSPWTHQVCE